MSSSSNLCEICHAKPKFQGHRFCGKTCAAQAGNAAPNKNLCINCHQKPKFGGYQYCGKQCASQAQGQRSAAPTGAQRQWAPPQGPPSSAPAQWGPPQQQQGQPSSSQSSWSVPRATATFIGRPQPVFGQQQGPPAYQTPTTQARASAGFSPPPGSYPGDDDDELSMYPPETPTGPPVASAARPGFECLIPGCTERPYKGSLYCSKKHREEAVPLGVAEACIMCLTLPQRDTDYFCGNTCREAALKKA